MKFVKKSQIILKYLKPFTEKYPIKSPMQHDKKLTMIEMEIEYTSPAERTSKRERPKISVPKI
jgi:hypothetical protein